MASCRDHGLAVSDSRRFAAAGGSFSISAHHHRPACFARRSMIHSFHRNVATGGKAAVAEPAAEQRA